MSTDKDWEDELLREPDSELDKGPSDKTGNDENDAELLLDDEKLLDDLEDDEENGAANGDENNGLDEDGSDVDDEEEQDNSNGNGDEDSAEITEFLELAMDPPTLEQLDEPSNTRTNNDNRVNGSGNQGGGEAMEEQAGPSAAVENGLDDPFGDDYLSADEEEDDVIVERVNLPGTSSSAASRRRSPPAAVVAAPPAPVDAAPPAPVAAAPPAVVVPAPPAAVVPALPAAVVAAPPVMDDDIIFDGVYEPAQRMVPTTRRPTPQATIAVGVGEVVDRILIHPRFKSVITEQNLHISTIQALLLPMVQATVREELNRMLGLGGTPGGGFLPPSIPDVPMIFPGLVPLVPPIPAVNAHSSGPLVAEPASRAAPLVREDTTEDPPTVVEPSVVAPIPAVVEPENGAVLILPALEETDSEDEEDEEDLEDEEDQEDDKDEEDDKDQDDEDQEDEEDVEDEEDEEDEEGIIVLPRRPIRAEDDDDEPSAKQPRLD